MCYYIEAVYRVLLRILRILRIFALKRGGQKFSKDIVIIYLLYTIYYYIKAV
jgi:hypothetical protein